MALVNDMYKNMQNVHAAATKVHGETKGIAHTLAEAEEHVLGIGKALLFGGAFAAARKGVDLAVSQIKKLYVNPNDAGKQYAEQLVAIRILQREYKKWRDDGGEYRTTEAKRMRENIKDQQIELKGFGLRIQLTKLYTGLLKDNWKLLATAAISGGLVLSSLADSVDKSHEFNKALIQANAGYAFRYGLVRQTLDAQRMTGAATNVTAEAARALAGYGFQLGDTFQSNVELVTMLHDGLGISTNKGAELAAVFEHGLKQSTSEVADSIAAIAQNSGLAAEQMASFADEIGDAYRTIGPGTGGVANEAVKVFGALEARVHDLHGNAAEIAGLFKQMTGGGPEGAMLRGQAGVTMAQLSSSGGPQAAAEGIARTMHNMITANANDIRQREAYANELYAVGVKFSMSAQGVSDFLRAMDESNKSLTWSAELQGIYKDQTDQLGEAWKRVRTSVGALLQEALWPFVWALNKASSAIAGVIGWLAKIPYVSMAVGLAFLATAAAIAVAATAKLVKKVWEAVPAFATLATALWEAATQAKSLRNATIINSVESEGASLLGAVGKKGAISEAAKVVEGATGSAAGMAKLRSVFSWTVIRDGIVSAWKFTAPLLGQLLRLILPVAIVLALGGLVVYWSKKKLEAAEAANDALLKAIKDMGGSAKNYYARVGYALGSIMADNNKPLGQRLKETLDQINQKADDDPTHLGPGHRAQRLESLTTTALLNLKNQQFANSIGVRALAPGHEKEWQEQKQLEYNQLKALAEIQISNQRLVDKAILEQQSREDRLKKGDQAEWLNFWNDVSMSVSHAYPQ